MVTVLVRVVVIVRYKGCGIWVLTALWGTFFQLTISPFSWMDAAMEGVGIRVRQMMESEAARDPEEERPKRKSLSMEKEVLMVAERGWQGRAARPPHRCRSRRRGQCCPARIQEH